MSSSDEDDEGDISEGEGGVELGTYSRQERERATAAFFQCASLVSFFIIPLELFSILFGCIYRMIMAMQCSDLSSVWRMAEFLVLVVNLSKRLH